jgi:predicted lipoprotein with Yx(FWY)xxD motif
VAAAAATLALLAAMIFLLDPPNTEAAGSQTTVVSTAKTKLGRVLVDSRGHTLYLFGRDRNGKSACSGQCASFWPPLIAKGRVRAEDGAKASLIGRTKRADGRMQVTYNHHPLYTFVKDTRKGQVKGEGFKAFGGVWVGVSPAGKKVVSGGGGGYSAAPASTPGYEGARRGPLMPDTLRPATHVRRRRWSLEHSRRASVKPSP